MAPTISHKIQTIVEEIVQGFNPQKIILFGSYAWGTPLKSSDVDLLIIKPSSLPPHHRVTETERFLYPAPLPLDVLVYTPAEIEQRKRLGDFFITRVLQKGKVLYEKK